MATHYEVLGVRRDAPPEHIRSAYLELARELHPDRGANRPPSEVDRAARRMQDVNEAWRILRDPDRRAAYDRSLTAATNPHDFAFEDSDDDDPDRPFHAPIAEPGDIAVSIARALPWIAVLVVLFGIFVFTAVAGSHRDSSSGGLVGRCVSSRSASAVVAVPCDVPNEGKVVLIVDRASLCPDQTTSRALEGDQWLCLRTSGTP